MYDVLAAENVDTTALMMPNWVPGRDLWSVSRGMFDNRYLLPPRRRPPFKDCDCQKEKDSDSEDSGSESESQKDSDSGDSDSDT